MREQQQDVLVIGGGHNGLVCAAYLAAAGLKVRVLERRHIVGGAAVTEEFHPGFRNSVASYTVSLLNPAVIRDLRLAEHGLRVVERPYANFLPLPDGRSFRLGGGHTEAEIAKFAPRDVARWADYNAMLDRVVAVLKEAGAGPEHMVRMTWYVIDRVEYNARLKELGGVYRDVIGRDFPAMTSIEVSALMEERAKVEIEVTAVLPDAG